MEWTVWDNGSGLMKNTISIPACRKILIDEGSICHMGKDILLINYLVAEGE